MPVVDTSTQTRTPIKHVGVIFDENISFDHYFGTYPFAPNPPGEPKFLAKPGTPAVNGFTARLLVDNPNLNPQNGTGAANPFRLDHTQASTADQDNDYSSEQKAYDQGKMDLFPKKTGAGGNAKGNSVADAPEPFNTDGLVMSYFDGTLSPVSGIMRNVMQ